jgi:hypothetical protein
VSQALLTLRARIRTTRRTRSAGWRCYSRICHRFLWSRRPWLDGREACALHSFIAIEFGKSSHPTAGRVAARGRRPVTSR